MVSFFGTQTKYLGASTAQAALYQSEPTTYSNLFVCTIAGCNSIGSGSSKTVGSVTSTAAALPSPSPSVAGLNCFVGLATVVSLTSVPGATACVSYDMVSFFGTQKKYQGATAAQVADFQAAPTTYPNLFVCTTAGCNSIGAGAPQSSSMVPSPVVSSVAAASPSPAPPVGLSCMVGLMTVVEPTFVVNATACAHYDIQFIFSTVKKYVGTTPSELTALKAAPATYPNLYSCTFANCNFIGSSISNTSPPPVVVTTA